MQKAAEPASGLALTIVIEPLVRLMRQLSGSNRLGTAATLVLNRLSGEGPQRLTELARAERMSQPGMTQLVTRLERAGFAERRANDEDRRAVVVDVTDAGAQFLDQRRSERAAGLQRLLDRLEPDEQAAIAAAIPALDRLVQFQTD
ncbi:MAG TPA: MarR family transcriptional regulator [Jatrophihabitans sp.]|jgi:DNA-binding MarR family transcriptional regulator|nr:MarR family transcriptional regulator [Jatrophihabitans sp.]